MSLHEYRRKRDFGRTPEPAGGDHSASTRAPQFVVQKHRARLLHYDFRLEIDGVLRSWAVPKGPSLDPDEKRLAVETEPHPLAYGDFEGVIPAGEYGGGQVLVWDRGLWFCSDDPVKALAKGHLKFRLEGEKLRGAWHLVRLKPKDGERQPSWLLIKQADSAARSTGDITEERPDSVISGLHVEQVQATLTRRRGQGDQGPRLGDPSQIEGARPAAVPKRPAPQLPTLVTAVPAGDQWWHEIKLDGYRLLWVVDKGRVRAWTRQGNDWTGRFGGIAGELASLACRSMVIDGEAVVLDRQGRSDFHGLQRALSEGGGTVHYYAFDLLYLDGYDLRPASLRARKEALRVVLARGPRLEVVHYGDHVVGHGHTFYGHVRQLGLEGLVSKRASAPYREGRTRNFVKIKCRQREEVVVVGYTEPEGSRVGLGALLVATRDGGDELRYAGKIGTGFGAEELAQLRGELQALAIAHAPVAATLSRSELRQVTWVEPRVVIEVEFHGWTDGQLIRHGVYIGRREDKSAHEVRREIPRPWGAAGRRAPADPPRSTAEVGGVSISHPDKVMFPERGLTKIELAEYYWAIAEAVLPGLRGRPLTLLRCPDGREGHHFYQKQANASIPASIPRVRVRSDAEYLTVHRIEDLLALVQLGVLEFHVWGAREDRLDRPDILVLDLDPDPKLSWEVLRTTAVFLRDRVAQLGLRAFARVTGGKGLHVVIPVERRISWDDAKAFTQGLAHELVRAAPDRYTASMSKARRVGKIFVDYLRNVQEATAIASYSVRAREGAPVACPVGWHELEQAKQPLRFSLGEVLQRVAGRVDPWADFDGARARLSARALRSVIEGQGR